MKISGKQRNELEAEYHALLWKFWKNTIGMRYNGISNLISETASTMVYKAEQVPENYGKLGQLRGWARKFRNSFSGDTQTEKNVQEVLYEVLKHSKLLMNGENILKVHECKFVDREEELYCRKEIPHGFKYCKEHWEVMEAKNDE